MISVETLKSRLERFDNNRVPRIVGNFCLKIIYWKLWLKRGFMSQNMLRLLKT